MDNRITDLEVVFVWAGANLDSTGNPLKHIFMKAGSSSILLNAKGDGFVELLYLEGCIARAVPNEGGFIGWTQANAHVSSEKKIELDLETSYSLVAVFGYLATFNGNGADQEASPQNINAVPGETIDPPDAQPVREGYIFGGWFKDEACTDEWDFDSNEVNSNITLYAKWTAELAETLVLSVDPEDGTIETGGKADILANIIDGEWEYDKEYLAAEILQGRAVFTGLKEGTTQVSYTAAGQTETLNIIIADAVPSEIDNTEPTSGVPAQDAAQGETSVDDISSSGKALAWYLWVAIAVFGAGAAAIVILLVRQSIIRKRSL